MGGSHQLRALDDGDHDGDTRPVLRPLPPHAPGYQRPPPVLRGRPRLVDDLHWMPLCHTIIERHRANPTHSWAALARGRGVHPRTLYNWRQAYAWLERYQPERLRRAIVTGRG
jgi:hypothetical protein